MINICKGGGGMGMDIIHRPHLINRYLWGTTYLNGWMGGKTRLSHGKIEINI